MEIDLAVISEVGIQTVNGSVQHYCSWCLEKDHQDRMHPLHVELEMGSLPKELTAEVLVCSFVALVWVGRAWTIASQAHHQWGAWTIALVDHPWEARVWTTASEEARPWAKTALEARLWA